MRTVVYKIACKVASGLLREQSGAGRCYSFTVKSESHFVGRQSSVSLKILHQTCLFKFFVSLFTAADSFFHKGKVDCQSTVGCE